VVVDQAAELRGDGIPDVAQAGEAAEARAEDLDRLELGRPRRPPARRRRRVLGRGGDRRTQELVQVAGPIAPIAARVDAQEREDPAVAPRADRVGMDAEDARGLPDGQGRRVT
jgi:hypothetical protein